MRHDLKTWPEPFQAVWIGVKKYEVRKDDRGYKVGDTLLLREWSPETKEYTGRQIVAGVTCKTEGGGFGLPSDMCVLGIEKLSFTG